MSVVLSTVLSYGIVMLNKPAANPPHLHAKSLQSCLTLCDPVDWSPPGSSVHGILQARTEYWSELPCPLPGDLLDSRLLHLLTPSKCLSSRP